MYVCIVLSNKKRNLRKYSVVFFKAFSKKKLFGGPCITYLKAKILNCIIKFTISCEGYGIVGYK